MLGQPTLGNCAADYQIQVTNSCGGGRVLELDSRNIQSLDWDRRLDDISEASVVTNLPCGSSFWERVCPGADYLRIIRRGIVEWHGPIVTLSHNGALTISARDPLWWTNKRYLLPGEEYDQARNSTELFETVVLNQINNPNGCETSNPSACFSSVYRKPGGSSTTPPTHDGVTTLDVVLEDYANSFLDYTVVGDQLFYGYQQVPIPEERQQVNFVLSDESWVSYPQLTKGVQTLVTDVFVITGINDSSSDEIIQFADTTLGDNGEQFFADGSYRKVSCNNKAGVHQAIVQRTELEDVEAVREAACALLDTNTVGQVFVDLTQGTALNGSVAWDTPRMIPGMVVPVSINRDGLTYSGQNRLNTVRVRVADTETVSVSLEPVGTTNA